ncbi:MAG: potassium-transporting ATPase subunit KdpA [Dehalococcoidia bacterium]
MVIDILQWVIFWGVLLALVFPVGSYMAKVFTGSRTWLDPVMDPVDNFIYKLSGIDAKKQQRWPAYVTAMLIVNAVMFILIFLVLELQTVLPLNPDHLGFVDPWLAFNTASSFITNTNWQSYGGESTLSYFSQMFAIIFPMFTSAATGLACGMAFIRGLGGSVNMGNFYVDLTRAITRVMLPIALVGGIVLVALGLPATFSGTQTVNTLNGPLAPAAASTAVQPSAAATTTPAPAPTATSQGQQNIALGLVAPLDSIKHAGTNGGGWFNANSSHPFENPNPITNMIENLLMALLPASLLYTLGIMLGRKKQAWILFGVMAAFFLIFLVVAYAGEVQGNPLLTKVGVDSTQGNMEGKELRFGQGETALFVTSTTAFTTGSVDAMHDSLTPLASITPLSQMMLNMVFGGKGVGFINMIMFVILTVFLVGLMVGRTPEFLGKRIQVYEVKLASISFLMHPLLILAFMAITFALQLDLSSISNPGFHGLSQALYAFTSASANNGSAFAGLNANTPWWNFSLGVVILLGRYISIILMLALAGSLAAKKAVPATTGTLQTDTGLFAGVLFVTIVIINLLSFFPALALGPLAEHFAMLAGKVF